MDIEQLQIILETVNGAGDKAMLFAYLFLLYKVVSDVLAFVLIWFAGKYIIRLLIDHKAD